MNPVRPEELSALLDGELDPVRAREVEARLAANPELRQELEAVSAADAAWRASARSADFSPTVRWPAAAEPVRGRWPRALGVTLGILIAARVVLKLLGEQSLAVGLATVSLALLLAGVVWLAGADRAPGEVLPAR